MLEPRHILNFFTLSLSRGWIPTEPGPAFILEVVNAEVSPPAGERR
jgi:hypothetical protein